MGRSKRSRLTRVAVDNYDVDDDNDDDDDEMMMTMMAMIDVDVKLIKSAGILSFRRCCALVQLVECSARCRRCCWRFLCRPPPKYIVSNKRLCN